MPNKLASETSPYLLQHAENPVAWFPWTEEALTAARERQQPILLSIGYSACHWCHVMAHESFEDPAIAAVMNEHFVNIKVDREERPDLDKIYQLAHQLLTQQSGGWPLTMFLDPDTLVPFFGGTYFPRSPRMQLPGFADLLLRINEFWQDKRDALKEQGQRISEVLDALNASPAADLDAVPAEQLMDQAVEQLRAQYDPLEGGFGDSPKFPMPGTLDLILRYRAQRRDAGKDIADMVMITLTKIARGGIHDHLGGGFFRYATDRKWMIPHFEKMLYDNGQLLSLYSDALALGPDPLFTEAARGTATWLLRDMRHPLGGFYAALDADSEGEEGRYYLWRRDDIKRHLSETEYLIVETLYGIDKPANFEGKWNLHRYDAWRSVVQRLSLEPGVAIETLEGAKAKLLAIRQARTPPALDDKILTAWNALAIKGLAKASIQLDEPAWLAAARDCVDFLRNNLWTGALLHATWKEAPKYAGYLDDYANLLDAIVTLLACGWRDQDARFALALADAALRDFEDPDNGGFFFTADDRDLIHRPKPTMDDALPPGNAVMIQVLMKLGHLFGETRYIDAAERAVRWARSRVQQLPSGHCQLLAGLELASRPAEQIIIRGPAADASDWLLATRTGYTPWRQVYAISYDGNSVLPGYLPALVSAEQRQRTVAYRCEGLSCSAPIDSIAELERVLGKL